MYILILLMVNIGIVSFLHSFPFFFFLFCLCNWIISNYLSLSLWNLSSAWSSLLLKFSIEFFSSVIISFSSSFSVWLFFVVFIYFLTLILFMHCFPDFISLPICPFAPHWASLRWLFWIFCQTICKSLFLSHWLFELY